MKLIALLLLTLRLSTCALAQKTESFAALNAGLFSFQGPSAEQTSQLNVSNGTMGYTNNPFGAKWGLSYGVAYQQQRVSKSGFILGLGLGYENLRSQTAIDAINRFDGSTSFQEAASGHSNLSNQFINGFPYLGYRLLNQSIWVDLTAGIDIGYLLKSTESGQATGANAIVYSSTVDRTNIKTDIRPRLQLAAGYARLGAYIGYAYGLANYRSGWVGGVNQCSAQLIRFGVLYKLRG